MIFLELVKGLLHLARRIRWCVPTIHFEICQGKGITFRVLVAESISDDVSGRIFPVAQPLVNASYRLIGSLQKLLPTLQVRGRYMRIQEVIPKRFPTCILQLVRNQLDNGSGRVLRIDVVAKPVGTPALVKSYGRSAGI